MTTVGADSVLMAAAKDLVYGLAQRWPTKCRRLEKAGGLGFWVESTGEMEILWLGVRCLDSRSPLTVCSPLKNVDGFATLVVVSGGGPRIPGIILTFSGGWNHHG